MSVLKSKRTESKAEYVNIANAIYIETINFLTRISARYSRLIAEPVAKLAGEVIDHAEKANSIYPSDNQRRQLQGTSSGGAGILDGAGCSVDSLLSHHDPEPAGMFHNSLGKKCRCEESNRKAGQNGSKVG